MSEQKATKRKKSEQFFDSSIEAIKLTLLSEISVDPQTLGHVEWLDFWLSQYQAVHIFWNFSVVTVYLPSIYLAAVAAFSDY